METVSTAAAERSPLILQLMDMPSEGRWATRMARWLGHVTNQHKIDVTIVNIGLTQANVNKHSGAYCVLTFNMCNVTTVPCHADETYVALWTECVCNQEVVSITLNFLLCVQHSCFLPYFRCPFPTECQEHMFSYGREQRHKPAPAFLGLIMLKMNVLVIKSSWNCYILLLHSMLKEGLRGKKNHESHLGWEF